MALEILLDPRIRSVEWRDLVQLKCRQIIWELSLWLPWLALSLWLAHCHLHALALLASFVFFLTGLRQVHNAFHYSLGLPRLATEAVMFLLSVLMLGSMHAVQYNHLQHHKHCMDDEDIEGMCARMPAWLALLAGPWFAIRMHFHAFRRGNRRRRGWITAELLANVFWVILVFGFWDSAVLRYHVAAMACGQCFAGFFAVWTVHHDCDRSHFIARTSRGRFKNLFSYRMFYHVEHHLFPQVPTCHLAQLAERLDVVAPELQAKQVF